MNSDTSTPSGESEAAEEKATQTPLVAALEVLFERDERWSSVPSPGGATLTRGWDDGTADTLLVLSPDTSYAWREDPQGREIIRIRGTAEQMIAAVCEWPAPGEPGAPDGSDHVPGPSGVWT
jgi:hypothetical protein